MQEDDLVIPKKLDIDRSGKSFSLFSNVCPCFNKKADKMQSQFGFISHICCMKIVVCIITGAINPRGSNNLAIREYISLVYCC